MRSSTSTSCFIIAANSPARRGVRFAFIVLLIGFGSTGCVRRRLMIRSDPPGALVYVDNVEVGTTPCAVNYTYYGTREIRLVKDGYETLTVNQPIPAPWWQVPPLDFFSETMVPREIHDDRSVTYNLSPQLMASSEQILARAEQLRQSTQTGANLPSGISGVSGIGQPGAATLPANGLPIAPSRLDGQTLPSGGTEPRYVQPAQ